jgi:hypothetical protein
MLKDGRIGGQVAILLPPPASAGQLCPVLFRWTHRATSMPDPLPIVISFYISTRYATLTGIRWTIVMVV